MGEKSKNRKNFSMTIKIKYFDIEKYEADWVKFYKDEQTIHSNRLLSPNDRVIATYFKDVEVETEKFIIYDRLVNQPAVFDYVVEIDNDYLYHDHKLEIGEYRKYRKLHSQSTDGVPDVYYSHLNGLKTLNKYYKKYKNPNLVNFNSGIFCKIDRELKLKNILE